MLGWSALFLATLTVAELARRSGLLPAFQRLAVCGKACVRLLARGGVSEWAKERAMRLMALRLFAHSARAGGLLAGAAAPFLLLLVIDHWRPLHLSQTLADWRANALLLAASSVYALACRRIRIDGRSGERALQRIALGLPPLVEMSFDIERRAYGPAARTAPEDHAPIFVAGLARAGTTVLTRVLHQTGDLASLTYRDLPFPLAPNSWARFDQPIHRAVQQCERPHGDGLFHDLDSPEAIEEVFWLNREARRYRTRASLLPVPPRVETIEDFRGYVGLVRLRYGKSRYLSKNNNNVLRLPALIEAFPEAVFLHPFREPLQQAASLLNQHQRACKLHAEDPFSLRFMTWLGHHEFGVGRRTFGLPDGPEATDDPRTIDYWLKCWISVHQWLLRQPAAIAERQLFLDYDAVCDDWPAHAVTLATRLRLSRPPAPGGLRPAPRRLVHGANPALEAIAKTIHAELQARSLRQFPS